MKRRCSAAAAETGSERELEVILDPQADVTLIDQRIAVEMGLQPIIEADLPKLGWIGAQRQDTYAAYTLYVRLTDDQGAERCTRVTAYGVDKEGVPLLLGNPFLKKEGIRIDCGSQEWRWGITTASIQLAASEDFLKDAECKGSDFYLLGVLQAGNFHMSDARILNASVA